MFCDTSIDIICDACVECAIFATKNVDPVLMNFDHRCMIVHLPFSSTSVLDTPSLRLRLLELTKSLSLRVALFEGAYREVTSSSTFEVRIEKLVTSSSALRERVSRSLSLRVAPSRCVSRSSSLFLPCHLLLDLRCCGRFRLDGRCCLHGERPYLELSFQILKAFLELTDDLTEGGF